MGAPGWSRGPGEGRHGPSVLGESALLYRGQTDPRMRTIGRTVQHSAEIVGYEAVWMGGWMDGQMDGLDGVWMEIDGLVDATDAWINA